MFLKTLRIENNFDTIRLIEFHEGLNLIIDETESKKIQESGNNVGKTTVLRLIDFCLGGNGSNIYRDPEFPEKSNSDVENFLTNNNIVITLVLKENLKDIKSKEIAIRRNFLKYKQKVQEINGISYKNRIFENKLKELIYNTQIEKPSFRQIISKNIRDEKNKLFNTIKVLHSSTTLEEYEALYFFWLGIETNDAERKQRLTEAKKIEEKILGRLRKNKTESEIKQALAVINRDIEELEEQKRYLKFKDNYGEEINKIRNIKAKINQHTTEVGRLQIRKELILESKHDLENEIADVDLSNLEEIYKSAKQFIPNLQRSFAELVNFHNNMIRNKVKFIEKELPEIESRLELLLNEISTLTGREKKMSMNLEKLGYVEELEEFIEKLNDKYEQKGKYEEQLSQWEKSVNTLENIESELRDINNGIATLDTSLETRIRSFNKYFSKLSERLYDEQFILSYDKHERAYQLKISSIGGNPGAGKKKGQIAAFDFAYIQFCEENDIPCLHFILHDQMENVHDNQLYTLSTIANETNSQFVIPVLKDKLPTNIDVKKYKVLSLSQEDKLFRIPPGKRLRGK